MGGTSPLDMTDTTPVQRVHYDSENRPALELKVGLQGCDLYSIAVLANGLHVQATCVCAYTRRSHMSLTYACAESCQSDCCQLLAVAIVRGVNWLGTCTTAGESHSQLYIYCGFWHSLSEFDAYDTESRAWIKVSAIACHRRNRTVQSGPPRSGHVDSLIVLLMEDNSPFQ